MNIGFRRASFEKLPKTEYVRNFFMWDDILRLLNTTLILLFALGRKVNRNIDFPPMVKRIIVR